MVMRCLKDKNQSLGLGLEDKVLVLRCLEDKSQSLRLGLEDNVLVLRCLEDKSESLGLGQGLKWGGMRRYGIPPSQSLSHDHTVYKRRKERLRNVPFCI